MAFGARTVGEAYQTRVVSAALTRWRSSVGGPAAEAAVRKFLDRSYPDLNQAARDAIVRTTREAANAGRQARSGGPGRRLAGDSVPDTSRREREAGSSGSTVFNYKLTYTYQYTDKSGRQKTGYYQDIFTSRTALTNREIQDLARESWNPVLAKMAATGTDRQKRGTVPTFTEAIVEGIWKGIK